MKLKYYLIFDSQSGICRLRKSPVAGFGEYVIKLDINLPDPNIPIYEINIPLPDTNIKAEAKKINYGVPWALMEGILEIKSVSPEGKLQLDYTDAGIKRLYEEAKTDPKHGWWGLREYAEKCWGLPNIYVEPARWEPLFPVEEEAK